ncbi:hypothetical protein LB505_000917 [Fusarium chuoi]|nr:hypothetical protein LB505_000917 [Fusarium chuoi]
MYMSSKERLREKEAERKRVSGGVSASSSGALPGESVHSGGRSDPFFAETAIREESHYELPIERPMDAPCAIPARNSSLAKTELEIGSQVEGNRVILAMFSQDHPRDRQSMVSRTPLHQRAPAWRAEVSSMSMTASATKKMKARHFLLWLKVESGIRAMTAMIGDDPVDRAQHQMRPSKLSAAVPA